MEFKYGGFEDSPLGVRIIAPLKNKRRSRIITVDEINHHLTVNDVDTLIIGRLWDSYPKESIELMEELSKTDKKIIIETEYSMLEYTEKIGRVVWEKVKDKSFLGKDEMELSDLNQYVGSAVLEYAIGKDFIVFTKCTSPDAKYIKILVEEEDENESALS